MKRKFAGVRCWGWWKASRGPKWVESTGEKYVYDDQERRNVREGLTKGYQRGDASTYPPWPPLINANAGRASSLAARIFGERRSLFAWIGRRIT